MTATSNPPVPQPIVHTLPGWPSPGDPALFAVISAGRDRVTMIESATKERAIFKLPTAATEIVPIVGDVISLEIKGPQVTRTGFYERGDKRWYEYDLKEPATEVHMMLGAMRGPGGGVKGPIGLSIQGPTITQLAAFDSADKRWTTFDLREPAKGGVRPSVTLNTVSYRVGRFLYRYSAIAKKWSVLELKRESSAPNQDEQAFGNGKMIIPEGDVIHVYDPKTGEWTDIDTKDDK